MKNFLFCNNSFKTILYDLKQFKFYRLEFFKKPKLKYKETIFFIFFFYEQ